MDEGQSHARGGWGGMVEGIVIRALYSGPRDGRNVSTGTSLRVAEGYWGPRRKRKIRK